MLGCCCCCSFFFAPFFFFALCFLDFDFSSSFMTVADGTDPFIMELIAPRAHTGPITYRQYADAYYRDFLFYTREKLGSDRLIMSRPVDGWKDYLFLNFSPRNVVFAGWTGDADPTFEGLYETLVRFVKSSQAKYVNFGSDIGGYRNYPGKNGPTLGRTANLFTRWFQLGAFCPLMENGGDNEHRPWKFDSPGSSFYTDLYRLFTQVWRLFA